MIKRTLLPKFSRIESSSFPRLVSMLLLVTAGPVLMPVLGQAPAKPSIRPLVLTHISVVDVASGLAGSDQTVVVRGNRIAEIGPSSRIVVPRDAEIIDGAGKYLIPGLADMHNHLVNPSGTAEDPVRSLAQLLRWGVTTVFSPAMAMEDYKRVKHATEGEPANLPRFYGVGPAFTARGGHMARFEHHGVEIPATPEDARSQVRALKSASVDAVKVIFDDLHYAGRPAVPAMQPEILAAIIDEAHSNGLKVYAHAATLRYAKDFLRAGGDGLVHSIIDEPVDDEFLSLMKQRKSFCVTTLTLYESFHDVAGFVTREAEFDQRRLNPESVYAAFRNQALEQANTRFGAALPEENLKITRANLKRVADSGIPVVTGTDTGVPGVWPGVASQLELVLCVEAGMTPAEALRASTLTAQRVLGRDKDLGEVSVGKLADLVVLDGNPLSDIHNVARVNLVVKGGVLYQAGANPAP
jgi:imidazolonepropionase-like amidohydrolase